MILRAAGAYVKLLPSEIYAAQGLVDRHGHRDHKLSVVGQWADYLWSLFTGQGSVVRLLSTSVR